MFESGQWEWFIRNPKELKKAVECMRKLREKSSGLGDSLPQANSKLPDFFSSLNLKENKKGVEKEW